MKTKDTKKQLLYWLIVIAAILAIIGVRYLVKSSQTKEIVVKEIAGVDDLDGSRIGVQIGTTGDIYASDYEGDEAGTTIERFNKGTDAIMALTNNKIDCVILDEQPAIAYTAKDAALEILDEEFALEDYAICISKENKELKTEINNALMELKGDGTLTQIIDNYIGDDEIKGTTPYVKKNVDRSRGTLTVATNAAFKPYEYYEDGVVVGIDMDIMQAICDKLGFELKIEDMEFDSIITAVVSGKADVGAAGMTVTEDRLKNIDFTDSYVTAKQVIIVNNGTGSAATQTLKEKFVNNFIEGNRYQYLLKGLLNTITISIFAVIIGIILGALIAVVRVSHDKQGVLGFLNFICEKYLIIVRGTPAMVQLLIFYYIILVSMSNKIMVASIAFGLNSAAYLAEIFRSGIMAVPDGQMEAGRSLGLSYIQTMTAVIIPQAFKNVLPTIGNEFISLIKETSVSGYIAIVDLTKGADIIRSNTYDAYMPLLSAAVIYLIIVMLLTKGISVLERRLRKNER